MLILHGGITYLHLHGVLWIDATTQCTFAEWIAAGRDPGRVFWRDGDVRTGFALSAD